MSLAAKAAWVAGLVTLGAAWLWPLPSLGIPPFSRHMLVHMLVVAVAAPLLAFAIAGTRLDPVPRAPLLFSPILASMAELAGVWAWHAPGLHHFARHARTGFVLEQATFVLTGLWLWLAALGGSAAFRRSRAIAGLTGLLLTSMHMMLLGVLLAIPHRLLYGDHGAHALCHAGSLTPLQDQQLGGVLMLLIGGTSYLAGALWMTADALRRRTP